MFLLKQRILSRLGCFLILYTFITAIGIYTYGEKSETTQADAAIVLGAAVWTDIPSPVFCERINHAVKLYKEGIVSKIIFTGGRAEGDIYSESYAAKIYAMEQGVRESDIYLEEESHITKENMIYAGQIVMQKKMNAVLIISDPLHMRRAMIMARDQGLNAYSSPTTTSLYKSGKSRLKFLIREVLFYSLYQMERVFRNQTQPSPP